MEENQLSDLHGPATGEPNLGVGNAFYSLSKRRETLLDHEEMGRVQQEPYPNRNIEYQVPRTLII